MAAKPPSRNRLFRSLKASMKVKNLLAAAVIAALVNSETCLAEIRDDGQGRDEAGYAATTLDSRVSRLEKRLTGQPLTEMSRDIESLRAEIKKLRGTVEELRNGLDKAKKVEKDHYADLEKRNADLDAKFTALTGPPPTVELAPPPIPAVSVTDPSAPAAPGAATAPGVTTPGAAPASLPPTTAAPGAAPMDPAAGAAIQTPGPEAAFNQPPPPPPPPPDPKIRQRDYEQAFETLKAGKYTDAIADFQTFVAKYPSGEFSDSAQYWLGEAHYVNRDYVAARESFRRMLTEFPQSSKVPDAELKLAYIEYENEQFARAKSMLNDLVKRHPDSSAAKMAEKRLERMKQEKR